jgi:RNA polymerase sigma-70 factor (ECF subfamily)
LTLLEEALARVAAEYDAGGKGALFARLRQTLPGSASPPAHADLARELGMSEAAVKKAAQRLRQRYRDAVRALAAETLGDEGDVDDEIRHLFAALAS